MKKIKKWISVALILGMLASVSIAAAASNTSAATKDSLRSQGAIRYQEGTESVVIDSADLYTLADRLDLFKVRTAEQLGAIGTYLSRNPEGTQLASDTSVYAVHQKPASYSETDPRSLSFDTILEGIAASQTIPTEPSAYGMGAATVLYKDADGTLHTDKRADSEEICIQAATAENLSAGTAAWVNGRLILGTGGDNKAYHERGYQEGSDDSSGGGGSSDPGNTGDVGKARVIDMCNGSRSYVVQEDMTDVFLCFSHLSSSGRTTPVLSSGESVKHVIRNANPDDGSENYVWDMYYVPKLTKGTVISNLHSIPVSSSYRNMSMLITVEASRKNDKVNGIKIPKDYVMEEDLTDVFIYTASPKSKMPNFTPMDDQEYVSFKLLKDVNFRRNSDSVVVSGCLYYVPALKAGTKISNISPSSSFLIY